MSESDKREEKRADKKVREKKSNCLRNLKKKKNQQATQNNNNNKTILNTSNTFPHFFLPSFFFSIPSFLSFYSISFYFFHLFPSSLSSFKHPYYHYTLLFLSFSFPLPSLPPFFFPPSLLLLDMKPSSYHCSSLYLTSPFLLSSPFTFPFFSFPSTITITGYKTFLFFPLYFSSLSVSKERVNVVIKALKLSFKSLMDVSCYYLRPIFRPFIPTYLPLFFSLFSYLFLNDFIYFLFCPFFF